RSRAQPSLTTSPRPTAGTCRAPGCAAGGCRAWVGSGKVGGNASQVTDGPCVERHGDPFVQFRSREPALGERVAQPGGSALPVAVTGPDTVICCPARVLVRRPAWGRADSSP